MLNDFKFLKSNNDDLITLGINHRLSGLPIVRHEILKDIRPTLKNLVTKILIDVFVNNLEPQRIYIDENDSVEVQGRWIETYYNIGKKHLIVTVTQHYPQYNKPLQHSLFFRESTNQLFEMYHVCTTFTPC